MPDEAPETASQQPSHSVPSANGTQANVFDVEDSPNNIVVENGQIKLATIEKLVERVTSEKYFDPNFLQVFLLTYRQFITPKQLIELLIARYNIVDPVGVSAEELENFLKGVLLPVRLRIYNAAKHWISRHWVDFDDNPELITLLRQLIKRMKETDQVNNAHHLEKLLKKMTDDQKKEFVYMFDKQPPKPIPIIKSRKTDHIPLLQIHPEEVARQLTLIEYDLFKVIKSWEFLNQGWTKKGKANKAPGILAMTKRFNDVSKWVATEIVSEKDKKGRVLVLNRLIEVAERCKNLNNLNAMTSIIAGLQSSSVYRLKALWPELPSKQLDIFEEMVQLISSKHSYKNFREYLRRCEPPCIPYLGVYLTDLTFIEDGNPNLVNGMLNVGKCRSISKVILEILQHQQTPYCLEPVPAVQQYLNNLKYLEEEQCYKLSLQIEARSSTPAPSSNPSSPQPASSISSSPASSPSPLSASGTVKGLAAANGMFAGSIGVSVDNMEVRIRLAGAKVPIRLPITAQTTAEDTIKSLTQQFYLQSSPSPEATEALLANNFQLVVPPSQTMYGAILEPDQPLKEFLAQNGDPVLEMWAHPIIYKVALSVQSNQPIFEDVLISHTMELTKTIPIFQKIFDLISSEEFCFLYVEPARDGYARFLRANRSLREEKCSLTEGRLLIYPASNFKTSAAIFAKGATKQGYLVKRSQAAKSRALQALKTAKKPRWFVLKDFFLFYFKSNTDLEQTHLGTIVLDYCSCKLVEMSGTKAIQLRSVCSEFASHSCVYLYSESESELDEWFGTINKRIVNSTSDMEGYLNLYVLPNTSKHLAQKKWFCLEKHGTLLQYAKNPHQPEYDDSISLEDCFCRLAGNEYNNRSEGESSFLMVTPQTQYLLVAGNVGLRDMWIEALAHHGVPFEKHLAEKTFGEDLDVIIQRENTTVPKFFTNAIQYLTAHSSDHGLFNTPAPQEEISRLRDMIDAGIDLDFATCSSVHVVGSLVLQFLQEIPNSLLSVNLYPKFVGAAAVIDDSIILLASLKALLDTVPNTNRAVLRQLSAFLHNFAPSHRCFFPIAATIMHDAAGKSSDACGNVLREIAANYKFLLPGPVAPVVSRPSPTVPPANKKAQMINIPRLSKIFKGAANSTSDLLAKVTNSPSREKHHYAHSHSTTNSANPSPQGSPSAQSPIGVATASPPTPSPLSTSAGTVAAPAHATAAASPAGGATTTQNGAGSASPATVRANANATAAAKPSDAAGAGASASAGAAPAAVDSQKVVVLYGDTFDKKLEMDLCGEKPWCTLRDFVSACEYDAGFLRSTTDLNVTIIADNFVVPPGIYQLHKPSRSDSFLSNRLKHLSIPVNQLLKFSDIKKANMAEESTVFKFPLNIQDASDAVTSVNPLGHLPRRTISRIPAPAASRPSAPIRKPRTVTSVTPGSRTHTPSTSPSPSPRSTTPTYLVDSPDTNDSDYSPPTTPTAISSPPEPAFPSPRPTPPTRLSRNPLNLSQGLDDRPPSPHSPHSPHSPNASPRNPAIDDGSESSETSYDPEKLRNSMHARLRRIAPPRQSEVAEVQHQIKQVQDGDEVQKLTNSPSMNSLASIHTEPTAPRLRRVQTQPILPVLPPHPHTSSSSPSSPAPSPSPSPIPFATSPSSSSPAPASPSAQRAPIASVVQRIISGKRVEKRGTQ